MPGGLAPGAPAEVKQAAAMERSRARWQAMIKQDYQAAYGYMSDASRKAVSVDGFRTRVKGVVFKDAEVRNATCDAEACKVEVFVTYDHPKVKGMGFPVTETWVLERGSLWYVDPRT